MITLLVVLLACIPLALALLVRDCLAFRADRPAAYRKPEVVFSRPAPRAFGRKS